MNFDFEELGKFLLFVFLFILTVGMGMGVVAAIIGIASRYLSLWGILP